MKGKLVAVKHLHQARDPHKGIHQFFLESAQNLRFLVEITADAASKRVRR